MKSGGRDTLLLINVLIALARDHNLKNVSKSRRDVALAIIDFLGSAINKDVPRP
jgi:hypothetical protein